MTWWRALIDGGAVPASYVPPPSAGASPRDAADRLAAADVVEDAELEAHAVPDRRPASIPPAVSFLNGMERWSVVAYDGVAQIVNAYVAAAVVRRDDLGVIRASRERSRTIAHDSMDRLLPTMRPRCGP